MRTLFQTALLWVTRRLIWFVVIVAILAAANLIRKEVIEFESLTNDQVALNGGKREIERHFQNEVQNAADRIKQLEKAAQGKLTSRVNAIDSEIHQRESEQQKYGAISSLLSSSPVGNGYLEYLKRGVEIRVLEQEKNYLVALIGYSESQFQRQASIKKLQDFHLTHVVAYAKLDGIARELGRTEKSEFCKKSWKSKFPLLWAKYGKLEAACIENAKAATNFKNQKDVVEGFKLSGLTKFNIQTGVIHDALSQLDQAISERDKRVLSNWAKKATGPVIEVIPTATLILLSLILTPILFKAFSYFVIAPLATRRPPINLFPEASGKIDGVSGNPLAEFSHTKVSAVSLSITVDELHELLIHPDYLQSSSIEGTKETKWLMDWTYPMSSLASGMIALTRIRTHGRETYVISATQDPLSEVGTISIADGSVFVFQPHGLVGILQPVNKPIHITSAWRFNSLHAWLTFQFRYLIFHGPAQLIVKGCRGIRVERAGTGRSINQAATLGFSANLDYSTIRCETFGAYLMGRDELLNDYFTGKAGCYVYEEMPNSGKTYGIFGRGIEGILDSLLKVFGI